MSSNRLEILKGMVEQNPADSFLRYGLAMEYRNGGDLEGAVREFRALMAANPDYSPAYFHGGQTLERLGRTEEAREVYEKGVEVTTRSGDQHARSEMQAALDMLGI
jgi:Flp pilus assembly protein TadD